MRGRSIEDAAAKVRALGLEHTEGRRTAEGAVADRCLSTPGGGGDGS